MDTRLVAPKRTFGCMPACTRAITCPPPLKALLLFCLILGTAALKDSGVSYKDVQQAVVGYVYGKYLNYILLTQITEVNSNTLRTVIKIWSQFYIRSLLEVCLRGFLKKIPHNFRTELPVAVPQGGLGELVPSDPKNQQKLSKKNDMNFVGYTSRLKNYFEIPPPRFFWIFQSCHRHCEWRISIR